MCTSASAASVWGRGSRRRRELREPGNVYARDDFTYWGFPAEGLRRLGRTVGLHNVEIVDEVVVDGHPRIVALMRAAT